MLGNCGSGGASVAAGARPTTLAELAGLWHREYLSIPGKSPDDTTRVAWLQAGEFFCDLRQPADTTSFGNVQCLRELSGDQARALARQEGFAGTLTIDRDVAEWHRQIDYQPATGIRDRARVAWDGAALLEFGSEVEYTERWSLRRALAVPAWGVRLVDSTHRIALLVRSGEILMLARGRPVAAAPGAALAAHVAVAATLAEQQDLVDCEISIGRIEPAGRWLIERSTLPFKVGRTWHCPAPFARPDVLAIEDLTDDGHRVTRLWRADPAH